MDKSLQVLVVDDSEDDTELILRELMRCSYRPRHRRVDTAEDLIAALDSQDWDLVLADYTMPNFSGTQALSIVRGHGFDVPFIFVSGTIGEETAVAAIKAGAQDYLMKDNLMRLCPAIERELRDAELRRERARLEVERRATEMRFRHILDAAADAIIAVDEDQRITMFNQEAERIFGYRADEVKGELLDLLLPARFVAVHRKHIRAFARSPVSAKRMNERGEVFGRRKDGSEFPAEATISKLAENGETAFTVIIRDVTERKRGEEKLRQLSRAVEQSASLVIITDADGVIQYANPKFVAAMGYAADEVIGRTPSILKSGKASRSTYAELWKTILAGDDWHGEFENRRKDGSLISVSATISPVKDESGRITHFIGIQEDITQRREIEEQLRRSQRMESLGQLTGGVAHDFNNVLMVILGNLELLQQDLADEPALHERATVARKAALRGAELTSKLLAFGGQLALTPKVIRVNEIVGEMSEILCRTLGETIRVDAELEPYLWHIKADPGQLSNALLNLCVNARDAMPKGGTLTINTANKAIDLVPAGPDARIAPGEYALLTVKDTGTGMPLQIAERAFEPFFTTKGPGKGTGLGLSMVYGFVKQSGGHVKIDSAPDQGTTITLLFPRTREEANGKRETACRQTVLTGTETVLVVEDDPQVQEVTAAMLQALGYRVLTAKDGPSALRIAESEKHVDLLFTDVVIPGPIRGPALAQELRARRPEVKVLFTSGYADNGNSRRSALPEGHRLLSKPFDLAHLADSVRGALSD